MRSKISRTPNGAAISHPFPILCRRSAGLWWHVETGKSFYSATDWKQQQLYIATGDLSSLPPHTKTRQMWRFLNLGCGAASLRRSSRVGFTSDRSGEVCVFWAPRCDTGSGHPAKAAQSSWRKNKYFLSFMILFSVWTVGRLGTERREIKPGSDYIFLSFTVVTTSD